MTVDEYAAKFLRLSRFAPKLVAEEAEEADRADRFQQGLRMDLQVQLSTLDFETYSQVLTKARNLERMLGKQERIQAQRPQKRPFQQMSRTDSVKNTGAPPANQPYQPRPQHMICSYCKRPDHL